MLLLFGVTIVTEVIHGRDTLFESILNEYLELSHLTDRVNLLMVLLLPSVIHITVDVELNSVVSSGNGLHIEVNSFVLLNLFDVVDVDQCEQVDKHTEAADHKSVESSLVHIGVVLVGLVVWQVPFSDLARSLQIEKGVITAITWRSERLMPNVFFLSITRSVEINGA